MSRLSLFPEDVVAVTEALGCPSISYTYSEPTAFYEYTQDTCKAAHARKLKNIVVTCGSIEERPARDLYQFVDAAHVDLKGFDEDTYKKLNSGKLAAILATLKTLNGLGVWFEIINLIVPTYTDNPDTIRRMCGWIVKELGPDRPLHFSRFQPQHKLAHLTPTPVETLVKARDAARAEGLHYVYIGNVPGLEGAETTWCPNCRKAVVERDIFAVTRMDITDGKCRFCGTKIAGVWGSAEVRNPKSEARSQTARDLTPRVLNSSAKGFPRREGRVCSLISGIGCAQRNEASRRLGKPDDSHL
jgi:pyruvate formate lyase activating enzyme